MIKHKIVTCELAPGDVISEKALIAELGVSRTPIREALFRLQQERLVDILPKRGIFVSTLSVQDVIDLFAVREVIEPFAARLATPNIPEAVLVDLKTAYDKALKEPLGIEDHIQFDRQFHVLVAEHAQNSYLMSILVNIYDQNSRIRFISLKQDPKREIEAIREHLALIHEMLKRSPRGAQEAMRRHIVCARMAALKAIKG